MVRQYLYYSFLLALIFGCFLSHNKADAQFYFGGKAGPTITNINGDFPGNNPKVGFSSGATIGVSFGEYDQYNIQADLLGSLRGFNQKFQEVSNLEQNNVSTETKLNYDNKLHLTYFEAPLTFKYSLSLGGGVFPYSGETGPVNIDFMVGPYAGFLVNSGASFNTSRETTVKFLTDDGEVEDEQQSSTEIDGGKFRLKNRSEYGLNPYRGLDSFEDVDIPTTLDGNLNSLDIGVTAGAGISFEISDHSTLGIEGRYTMGFLNIDDTFFNDYEVSSSVNADNTVDYDVTANKADLTNSGWVAYLSWTYQLSGSTY